MFSKNLGNFCNEVGCGVKKENRGICHIKYHCTSPGRCRRVLCGTLAGNADVVSSLPSRFNLTERGFFFTVGQNGLLCK